MNRIARTLLTLLILGALVTGALMVLNAAGDNATNDSLATAEEITAGSVVSGSISPSDTDDYYKVNIASGKIITLSFTPTSTNNMYLWFGDTNGDKITEISSKSGLEESFTHFLAHDSPAGYHFIRVYYTEGSYSFKVTLTDQNDAGSGGDAPTEIIDAMEINADTQYSGELRDWDGTDMYKIWIDSGKIVKAIFTPSSINNMYFWVGNTDGNKAFEISSKGAIEISKKYYTANETEAGYWYFKIYYTEGTYTFTVELSDQDDGGSGHDVGATMLNAYEVEPNVEYNGHLYDLDNDDYYKMWIKKGASVGVSFSASTTGNMYIWVGDTEGDKVYEISSSGGVEDVVPTVSERPSGYWWVRVYYADGAYAFKITATGGVDENMTDDDVSIDDDVVVDDDVVTDITVVITIRTVEVTVVCDVDVDMEEVDSDYVDDIVNGTHEEQLKVQKLEDLDVMFQINEKNEEDEAKDIHIELDIKEKVPKGTKAENVKLFWLDEEEGEWVEVKDSEYDPSSGMLEADIDHLTVFAAYAKEEDQEMDDSPGYEIFLALVGSLVAIAFIGKRKR